jgi:hypothetical protein
MILDETDADERNLNLHHFIKQNVHRILRLGAMTSWLY